MPGPYCVFSLFLNAQHYFLDLAKPAAWSLDQLTGLVASTSVHGPLTVGAVCNVPSNSTVRDPSALRVTEIDGSVTSISLGSTKSGIETATLDASTPF